MNNTVLKILAAILALGAVAVAVIGIRLSQQPAAPKAAALPASAPVHEEVVVVAARNIRMGKALGPADFVTKKVPAPPAQAFRQTDGLIGRIAAENILAGTPLLPSQFHINSMGTLLRPGERAVAIEAREVGGLGGYARPGDLVDVLAYSPENNAARTQAFAQVAIRNARILSIGDISLLDEERQKTEGTEERTADEPPGPKTASELKTFRQALRSAVLAIPESEATRLLLLAEAGRLRLALRPMATVTPDPLGIQAAAPRSPVVEGRSTVAIPDLAPEAVRAEIRDTESKSKIVIQEGSKERALSREDRSANYY